MHGKHRTSLNAIRVFAVVARTGSLTAAGIELSVTSSAVSHQIRKLEDDLGVRLFRRGSNTVSLTEVGQRLFQEVAPGIGLIDHAIASLYRDEAELTVQASTSLAVRWLIPSLDRFRKLCPTARVSVETGSTRDLAAAPAADVSIRYFRNGDPAAAEWKLLARDLSRPVISPNLLERGKGARRMRVANIPALQRATANWDWKLWCEVSHISPADLNVTHAFDTDDAAIHACVAGLGMVLAPPILTTREMEAGTLVVLPGYAPVEIGTYRYRSRPGSRMVKRFCAWMDAEMGGG